MIVTNTALTFLLWCILISFRALQLLLQWHTMHQHFQMSCALPVFAEVGFSPWSEQSAICFMLIFGGFYMSQDYGMIRWNGSTYRTKIASLPIMADY